MAGKRIKQSHERQLVSVEGNSSITVSGDRWTTGVEEALMNSHTIEWNIRLENGLDREEIHEDIKLVKFGCYYKPEVVFYLDGRLMTVKDGRKYIQEVFNTDREARLYELSLDSIEIV